MAVHSTSPYVGGIPGFEIRDLAPTRHVDGFCSWHCLSLYARHKDEQQIKDRKDARSDTRNPVDAHATGFQHRKQVTP